MLRPGGRCAICISAASKALAEHYTALATNSNTIYRSYGISSVSRGI
jgi:hypothetical protein